MKINNKMIKEFKVKKINKKKPAKKRNNQLNRKLRN